MHMHAAATHYLQLYSPCIPINSMLAEYTTVLMRLLPFIDAIKLKHMALSSWIGNVT
jgi:hypothetical protein